MKKFMLRKLWTDQTYYQSKGNNIFDRKLFDKTLFVKMLALGALINGTTE